MQFKVVVKREFREIACDITLFYPRFIGRGIIFRINKPNLWPRYRQINYFGCFSYHKAFHAFKLIKATETVYLV